jgi:hypothetical protein
VARDSKIEFVEAVRECLASCYGTDFPLAVLGEYVELLKQRGWTPSEIHKVEAAVTKILLAVVSQEERDSFIRRIIKPRSGTFPRPASGGPAGGPVLPPNQEFNSGASSQEPKRS